MPRGIPSLTEVQRSEIIKRVTDNGERVSDLAREYNIVPKTIYNLFNCQISKVYYPGLF